MALAPYVTALPNGVGLNVCTASGVVIDAFMGPGHTEFSAGNGQQLAQNRANTTGCFPSPSSIQAATGTNAGKTGGSVKFGQTSSFFRLTSYITIGSTEFSLYSLMYQDQTGALRPIQRSFTAD
jgi:general secretion pathway protein K